MIYHTFSFHNLPADQLLPHLTDFIEQSNLSHLPWHPCWLNNEGEQVIGLLPKNAWSAYKNSDLASTLKEPTLNIEILKTSRQESNNNIELQSTSNLPSIQSHSERYVI